MNSRLALLVVNLLVFSGCASVKVEPETVKTTSRLNRPSTIYVQQFASSKGLWEVDRLGEELAEFKKNASIELSRMMIERFPEIAPTQEAPASLPKSGLLIAGEFVTVKQGSRALRMGVGFGAGGTKVETMVRLYDLARSSTEPVATFQTTGGSNAEPGWLAGGWIAGGLNATGLQTDWERTAREIRNFILEQSAK